VLYPAHYAPRPDGNDQRSSPGQPIERLNQTNDLLAPMSAIQRLFPNETGDKRPDFFPSGHIVSG
jgi:hypothetical protein